MLYAVTAVVKQHNVTCIQNKFNFVLIISPTTTSYLFKALLFHILQKKALGSGQTDLMFMSPVCFDSRTLTRHFPFDWPYLYNFLSSFIPDPLLARGQEGAQLYFLPHQFKFYVPIEKWQKQQKYWPRYNYNVSFLCTSIPLYSLIKYVVSKKMIT